MYLPLAAIERGDSLTISLLTGKLMAYQRSGHRRRIPSPLTRNCIRKAKLKDSSVLRSELLKDTHRLAAFVESIVDADGGGSVFREEPSGN